MWSRKANTSWTYTLLQLKWDTGPLSPFTSYLSHIEQNTPYRYLQFSETQICSRVLPGCSKHVNSVSVGVWFIFSIINNNNNSIKSIFEFRIKFTPDLDGLVQFLHNNITIPLTPTSLDWLALLIGHSTQPACCNLGWLADSSWSSLWPCSNLISIIPSWVSIYIRYVNNMNPFPILIQQFNHLRGTNTIRHVLIFTQHLQFSIQMGSWNHLTDCFQILISLLLYPLNLISLNNSKAYEWSKLHLHSYLNYQSLLGWEYEVITIVIQ